jgi:hypothetical protein
MRHHGDPAGRGSLRTLVYALKFDERGRERKSGYDGLAKLGAMELLKQLKASNFIVLKGPARRNHSTG